MGATSVTGSGIGAAWVNKGPSNNRNVYVSKLTPHIVASGNVTLAAGAASVVFPTPIDGAPTNYVVILTSAESAVLANQAVLVSKAGSTTFTGFTVAGTTTQSVSWMVITIGVA